MVDALKALLILQIKEVFPGAKVHDEPIQQGLKPPAFLLLIFNDDTKRQLRHRMYRDIAINVTYFPENERSFNTECDSVAEKFKYNFRRIANKHHVNRLEAVKHDGVLIITFNVRAVLEELFDETKMETLKFGGVGID